MSDHEADAETGTIVEDRSKIEHPKMYKVVLLNDDYTSMDFVVAILENIFRKSPQEAVQIMLQVHNAGRGVCGVFAREIAEAKTEQVHSRARGSGFPLRCAIEEA